MNNAGTWENFALKLIWLSFHQKDVLFKKKLDTEIILAFSYIILRTKDTAGLVKPVTMIQQN